MFSSPPAALMALLFTCEELCESILAGVQVGEFAVVQPLSVEHSCILGYLLAWKLLLTFFKSSPSHVSHDEVLIQSNFSLCFYYILYIVVNFFTRMSLSRAHTFPKAQQSPQIIYHYKKYCHSIDCSAPLVYLQLRAHYAQYLKRSCSLNKLLLHLFKLMPENPLYPGQGADTKETKTFFTESLSLAVESEYT